MYNDTTMKPSEIIFLLGAGASFDAKIPVSKIMLEQLEIKLADGSTDNEWNKYKNLYYCIKSGIQYGIGIANKPIEFNIETIINTIEELLKSYEHPIYPFVGSWVPRLTELAGVDFVNIKNFKKLILTQLRDWMEINKVEDCDYYCGLIRFQKQLEFPLSIFTLNYDLCLETQCKKNDTEYNRGFDNGSWSYKNFQKPDDIISPINIYKIHGSIDWELKNHEVHEKIGTIDRRDIEELALIFGTSYKFQYIDPFLFLFSEFRRILLEESATKYIVCIGYSFNDEHINGILRQAVQKVNSKIIISIQPFSSNGKDLKSQNEEEKERLCAKLGLTSSFNIHVDNVKAKDFFENIISKEYFMKYYDMSDLPF